MLRRGLAEFDDMLEFSLPTHSLSWDSSRGFNWDASGCRSVCSWFGFKIGVKDSAKFTRTDLARELDKHNIGNRMLFGGNLLRQPAFVNLSRTNPDSLRVVGSLSGSDAIMKTLFRHLPRLNGR